MKSYKALKEELKSRRKNTKGFNEAFYKIFMNDLETIKKAIGEAEKLKVNISTTDLWNKSETHKTYFYKNNGGAFCEFLELI